LPGGELIDCLQNIAGNVADRQHLNSRRLRQWSNSSGALTSSSPKINLRPSAPAIIAGSVVIVLFIYIYFVHHLNLRERRGEVPKKFENFPETPERLIQWLTVARLRWKIRGNLANKKLRCRKAE
jgi:hypothetical protein